MTPGARFRGRPGAHDLASLWTHRGFPRHPSLSAERTRALLPNDVDRLQPLRALFDFELDDLVLIETPATVPRNLGVVNEDVRASVLLDEPPALLVVEPLNPSHSHRNASTACLLRVPAQGGTPLRCPR